MVDLQEALLVSYMVLIVLTVLVLIAGRIGGERNNIDSKYESKTNSSVWEGFDEGVREPYKTIARVLLVLIFVSIFGFLGIRFILIFS